MRVDVQARRTGQHYVIECSACGPLGVVIENEALESVKQHLVDHGADQIEEGATE